MRTVLDAAGVPVPAYRIVDDGPGAPAAVASFAATHGWPLILKSARGGYDGKGVWPVAGPDEADAVLHQAGGQVGGRVVVEELVPLDAELAVMVARRPSGSSVAWPAVETAQLGGVCREVLVPGRLSPDVVEAASALGQKVAEIAGAVGVMAVELFWSQGRLLVNEVATRPHNSGHWTIEGAVTSQFENHVRAVLDLPLGSTAPRHARVASVNVFGGPSGRGPRRPAGTRARRGGRARPPLRQGCPARPQTGARDRVRGRRRRRPRGAPGPPRWPSERRCPRVSRCPREFFREHAVAARRGRHGQLV